MVITGNWVATAKYTQIRYIHNNPHPAYNTGFHRCPDWNIYFSQSRAFMNILPAPDTDGRGDLGALYDTLGLDELSEDQRALVEDLHDERDDDTGC